MGNTESRYSQPKLELYGLYRALRHFQLHIIGVQTLIVEVDAKYIKEMLNKPDLHSRTSCTLHILHLIPRTSRLVCIFAHITYVPRTHSHRISHTLHQHILCPRAQLFRTNGANTRQAWHALQLVC
jgi:hypothetical protein